MNPRCVKQRGLKRELKVRPNSTNNENDGLHGSKADHLLVGCMVLERCQINYRYLPNQG